MMQETDVEEPVVMPQMEARPYLCASVVGLKDAKSLPVLA